MCEVILKLGVVRNGNIACLVNIVATFVVGRSQRADHKGLVRFLQHANKVLEVFARENVTIVCLLESLCILNLAIGYCGAVFLLKNGSLVVFS